MLNHVIVRRSCYCKPKEIVKLGVEQHLVFGSPLSTPYITILFHLPTVKFSRLIQVLRDKTFRKHGISVSTLCFGKRIRKR